MDNDDHMASEESTLLVVIDHDPSIPYPTQWLPLHREFPHLSSSHIQQVDSELHACQTLLVPQPLPGPPQKGTLKRVRRTLIRCKHILNILEQFVTSLQQLPDHDLPHPSLNLNPQPTSPQQLLQLASDYKLQVLSTQSTLLDLAASRFPDEMLQRILHHLNTSPALPILANGPASSY